MTGGYGSHLDAIDGDLRARRVPGRMSKTTEKTTPASATGLKLLGKVLKRLRWNEQGGYVGYRGKGRWSFIRTTLPYVTPEELNELFKLAGVVPDKIVPLGTCRTCKHSINGRERGYAAPCGSCKRPRMTNYVKLRMKK